MAAATTGTLPRAPESLKVQEIVYYPADAPRGQSEQEAVKAAMINDWVYHEGQELVDYSSGRKLTFQVLRIMPGQVVLRRGQQDYVLPYRSS
jgi:hypothetical protein